MSASRRDWKRPLLAISLALNLFFVGLLAAAWIAGPDGAALLPLPGGLRDHRPRTMGVPGPHELRRALPEADQGLLSEVLAAHRGDIVPRFEKLWNLRDEVTTAMAAEPFDRPALEALFERLRAQESDVAAAAQRMVADLLERLSPEDRAKVAALMPVRPPRPPDAHDTPDGGK